MFCTTIYLKLIKRSMALIAFFMLISLFSCEEVVDFKGGNTENFIVINGVIQNNSAIHCRVTSSKSIFEVKSVKELSDASVHLFVDGVFGVDMVYDLVDKEFKAPDNIRAQIGIKYTIKVNHEDYKDAEASCIVEEQPQVTLKSVEFGESEITSDDYYSGSEVLKVEVEVDDQPGEDYYQVKLYVPKLEFNYEDHTIYLARPIQYAQVNIASNDAVLHNNIFQGADGFEDEIPNEAKVFNDILFDGEKRSIVLEERNSGSWATQLSVPEEFEEFKSLVKCEVMKISKDLYLYLRSYEASYYNDGDPFTEPVKIHTNVFGGAGILGASTSKVLTKE